MKNLYLFCSVASISIGLFLLCWTALLKNIREMSNIKIQFIDLFFDLALFFIIVALLSLIGFFIKKIKKKRIAQKIY